MKITIISPRYHTNIDLLFSEFRSYTRCIEVLTHTKGLHNGVLFKNINIGLSRFNLVKNNHNSIFKLASFMKLKSYLKKIDSSIIIIRDPYTLYAVQCIFFLYIYHGVKIRNKIYFYTQSPIYTPNKLNLKRKIQYNILSRFSAHWFTPVLTRSKNLKYRNKYLKYFSVPVEIKTVQDLHKEKMRILSVGKYVKRKNFEQLISIFTHYPDIRQSFDLTIVGEVSNENHERFLENLNESAANLPITFIKNLTGESMNKLYSAADLFVLNSWNEDFSISPIEAAQFGKISILNVTNGAWCQLKDYDLVLLTNDCGDEKDLVSALREVLNRRLLLSDIVNRQKITVQRKLDFKNYFNL